jgi:hypothetical protein
MNKANVNFTKAASVVECIPKLVAYTSEICIFNGEGIHAEEIFG